MLQLRRLSCGPAATAGGASKAMRNILDLSFEDLAGEMTRLGQPAYRARQLWTYVYNKLGTSFDHVPGFPERLKQQLKEEFVVGGGSDSDKLVMASVSSDGTRKWCVSVCDGGCCGVAVEVGPVLLW